MGIRNVVKYVWGSYADTLWFPSPCGEMGIRNRVILRDRIEISPLLPSFPSPCGEMGIRNIQDITLR